MSSVAPLTNAICLAAIGAIVAASVTTRGGRDSRIPRTDHQCDTSQVGPIRSRADDGVRIVSIVLTLTSIIAATWLGGPILGGAVALSIGGAIRAIPIAKRRQAQRARVQAVPEALDLVVVLLQAGATPRQTFVELGRRGPRSTRSGFAAVARLVDQGQPFAAAIGALGQEVGPAITPFVELIAAAERTGLATAHLVHQLSTETRALRRRHDEAAARTLPVKLSFPLVLCTLPSFVLLAIAPAVLAALSSLGTDAW
jgi:tight adherence protein C